MRPCLFLVLWLAAGAQVSSAGAQTPRGIHVENGVVRILREGDELFARMRPLEAMQLYRGILEDRPTHHEALWRAARVAVSLGTLAVEERARTRWYEEAERYARLAIDAAPDGVEGHHWMAVAVASRARHEGVRARVRLATVVREEALRVLSLDSLHPGGHHVLGRWHAEILGLSGIGGFVARTLLGEEVVRGASWELAERHLRRALELAPQTLVYHLELARLHLELDRPQEAEAELREVLSRPALDPADPVHKQAAQELLARARRKETAPPDQEKRLRAPLSASSTLPFTSSARSSQRSPAVSRISPAARRIFRLVRRPGSGAVSSAIPAPRTAPRIRPEMKFRTCAS